uniref:Response regulatory domain-containing protein n=1 Tax=Fagus sylvatica TaxID=28930 RepID=A0A2N9HNE4_FAGSY
MGPAIDSASRVHVSGMGNGVFPVHGGGLSERNDNNNNNNKSNGHPFSCKNKLTALVVDSERVCRVLEKAFLLSFGVETEAVETGEAAVELIASGANFNLIVIDMFLPVMNGPETARQIRAMGVQSRILGITPMFDERDQQEFLAAGVDEFIEKPLSPEILIPILMELDNQI